MFVFFKSKDEKCKELLKKANSFYHQKKFAKAIKLYQKILKTDSQNFAATVNIATSYFELEEYELSIPFFQKAITCDKSNPWWHNYLSQSAQKTGDFKTAIDEAWTAVLLDFNAYEHHLNLAYTLYEISTEKGEEYIDDALRKWYEKFPENPIAKQCYKSFYFDKNFKVSEPEYVEKLFDVFAQDFDSVLKELNYDSPVFLARNIAEFFKENNQKKIQILDIGCGSGLCGCAIKKILSDSQITGVDISQNMLVEAHRKNVYHKLVKGNITDCFGKIKTLFDVVVSSDVFTYFGDLDSVFFGVSNALRKGGLFSFTYTLNNENLHDWFLAPSSRFLHSQKYINDILRKNGFRVVKNEEKILRKEGEKEVKGMCVSAVKK